MKDLETQVKEAVDEANAPEAWESSEEVSSGEVNPTQDENEGGSKDDTKEELAEEVVEKEQSEVAREESSVKEWDKVSEQIKNLNKALQQERDEKREIKTRLDELSESTSVVERMKSLFTEEEEVTEEKTPEFLTKDQLDEYLNEIKEKEESKRNEDKLKEEVSGEIKTLTEEFDGKEWKPLYKDDEVLKWQDDNKKLHLRPSEAFYEMKRQDIIDYEVSKRINSQTKEVETEKPSWMSADHTPEEKTPKNSQEMRSAILEAISSSNKDI